LERSQCQNEAGGIRCTSTFPVRHNRKFCRPCAKMRMQERSRLWKEKNRPRVKEMNTKWKKKHSMRVKIQMREAQRRWRRNKKKRDLEKALEEAQEIIEDIEDD